MKEVVKVPALGESITEAIVSRWEVKVGQAVEQDAPIAELETDKVMVTVNAPVAGVVVELKVEIDAEVAVGEAIAIIDTEATATTSAQPSPAEPSQEKTTTSQTPSTLPMGPAAKRVVEEHKLDPASIPASGPKGHITKGDALAAAKSKPQAQTPTKKPAQAQSPPAAAQGVELEERVPMRTLRKKIAERLVEVQHTAAILTTFNEVDMSEVLRLRKEYREAFEKKYGIRLGFMSFFTKATIEALKAFPMVNAEVRDDAIIYKNYYHIGVAVGGGRGLVVPVIKHADQLSFAEVELELTRLAKRAQNNQLTLDELQGGTFTISNGGVYGSMMSTPILNAPQSGILGMHNIVQRPVVVNGEIVIRPMMYLALSYDHRIIDGREAVQFLVRIKECIEHPERLLLEV